MIYEPKFVGILSRVSLVIRWRPTRPLSLRNYLVKGVCVFGKLSLCVIKLYSRLSVLKVDQVGKTILEEVLEIILVLHHHLFLLVSFLALESVYNLA